MLTTLLLLASSLSLAQAADEPDCLSAYGSTSCGWDCTAAYGEVQCAQTPRGQCNAAYGEVTCWDPPAAVRSAAEAQRPRRVETVRPRAEVSVPESECLSAYGTTACGWDCTAAYGEVECAQWPGGQCEAAYGEVTCGPVPPPRWRTHWNPSMTPATCESAYGTTACGWDCTAAYGEVKCAATPRGQCEAAYGSVTCWDPR